MSKEFKPDRRTVYLALIILVFGAYKLYEYLTGTPFTFDWRGLGSLLPLAYAVGAVALVYALRFRRKSKKCVVCGEDTMDHYMNESDRLVPMCRKHLIEKWKGAFLSSTNNMVAIEPDFEAAPGGYLYASTQRLVKEWNYEEKDAANIDRILALIPNTSCRGCRKPASIAWIEKKDYAWPYFSKISAEPTFYCKQCAASKIEPLVLSSKEAFSEGLYAPRPEEGIYHVQEF